MVTSSNEASVPHLAAPTNREDSSNNINVTIPKDDTPSTANMPNGSCDLSPPASRPPLHPPPTPSTPRGFARLSSENKSDISQRLFLGPCGDATNVASNNEQEAGLNSPALESSDVEQKSSTLSGADLQASTSSRESQSSLQQDSKTQDNPSSPAGNNMMELAAENIVRSDTEDGKSAGNRDGLERGLDDSDNDEGPKGEKVAGADGELSGVHSPGPDGNEDVNGFEDPYRDDNDTDTAEESCDPYRNCEHNLLVHVSRVHGEIESQLEALEKQIIELERCDQRDPSVQLSEENVLNDLPALKKLLTRHTNSLSKVQRLASFR